MSSRDQQRSERRTHLFREQLHRMAERHGFSLLADRRVPNVNHPTSFLVSPSRVYAISERTDAGEAVAVTSGAYPHQTSVLLMGGVNRTHYITEVQSVVSETRLAIDTPGVPFTPVIGILVLSNVDLDPSSPAVTLQNIRLHGLRLSGAFEHEYVEPQDAFDLVNVRYQRLADAFPEFP